MSVDTLMLLAFWAALVPLAYIGSVDIVVPDLFTIPATIAGVALAYFFDPSHALEMAAGVCLGYCIPLMIGAVLKARNNDFVVGLGTAKGCGMLGAYLGIKYTLVALAILFVFVALLSVVLKMRMVRVAVPMAFAGFVASVMRLVGWP